MYLFELISCVKVASTQRLEIAFERKGIFEFHDNPSDKLIKLLADEPDEIFHELDRRRCPLKIEVQKHLIEHSLIISLLIHIFNISFVCCILCFIYVPLHHSLRHFSHVIFFV